MTDQEIMQLAKEAGFDSFFDVIYGELVIRGNGYDDESVTDEIKRLIAMVAEREREACLAEIETGIWLDKTTEEVLSEIAAAIRARAPLELDGNPKFVAVDNDWPLRHAGQEGGAP